MLCLPPHRTHVVAVSIDVAPRLEPVCLSESTEEILLHRKLWETICGIPECSL